MLSPSETKEYQSQYQRQYYVKHKAEILEHQHEHRDRKREYDKQYYLLHRDEVIERKKKYYAHYSEGIKEYCRAHPEGGHNRSLKRKCGSVEKYNEAMLKYDGWCAFGCDRKAYLVHHMDGKNIFNSPKEQVNNNLSNLLPLCLKCHGWLHHKSGRYIKCQTNSQK